MYNNGAKPILNLKALFHSYPDGRTWLASPSFAKATHIASLGTESYAFFQSMKVKKALDLCSHDLSRKDHVGTASSFPNPHCDSSSATSFPTTSNSGISLCHSGCDQNRFQDCITPIIWDTPHIMYQPLQKFVSNSFTIATTLQLLNGYHQLLCCLIWPQWSVKNIAESWRNQ